MIKATNLEMTSFDGEDRIRGGFSFWSFCLVVLVVFLLSVCRVSLLLWSFCTH